MNYAIITTKVDPLTKKEAQKAAEELGIPLSTIIKGFLKQFIRTKTINFSAREDEIPNKYLRSVLRQTEKDIKLGKVVSFKNGKAALQYINSLIEHDRQGR